MTWRRVKVTADVVGNISVETSASEKMLMPSYAVSHLRRDPQGHCGTIQLSGKDVYYVYPDSTRVYESVDGGLWDVKDLVYRGVQYEAEKPKKRAVR